MIEFHTGSIMLCERSLLLLFFSSIQMINVIRLVRGQNVTSVSTLPSLLLVLEEEEREVMLYQSMQRFMSVC